MPLLAGRRDSATTGTRKHQQPTTTRIASGTGIEIPQAQLALAVAFILTAKLIDWRNCWITRSVTYSLSQLWTY